MAKEEEGQIEGGRRTREPRSDDAALGTCPTLDRVQFANGVSPEFLPYSAIDRGKNRRRSPAPSASDPRVSTRSPRGGLLAGHLTMHETLFLFV